MNKVTSVWKDRLDAAVDLESAEAVMTRSIGEGTRPELLEFLGTLYEEFVGPDPMGGETGTLQRMGCIVESVSPTEAELENVGINPKMLREYLSRRG